MYLKIDYDKYRNGFDIVFVTKIKPHQIRKYQNCLLRTMSSEKEDKSQLYFSAPTMGKNGLVYMPKQCKKCLIIEMNSRK